MTHYLRLSHPTKRVALLLGMMVMLAGSAWAQATQIGVTGTQIYGTKVYDGTTHSGVYNVGTLSGVSYLHNVLVTADAHYLDRHVGTNKPVVITYSIEGPDAYLYLAPASDTLYADITPAHLNILGSIVANKVYDGTTSASMAQFGLLNGVAPVDSGLVFVTCLAQFLTPGAGLFRPVSVNYGIVCAGDAQATDYIAPASDTLTATISPLQAYVSGIEVASSKTYDGTRNCAVTSNGTVHGLIDGDTILYNVNARYRSRHASNLKAVDVTIETYGPMAANYTLADTNVHISRINPLSIVTFDPQVQLTKEYDGNDSAIVLVPGGATNIFPFDTVDVLSLARYDSPEVGHNKQITCSWNIYGPQSGNYTCGSATRIISNDGSIILPTEMASLTNTGELLVATAEGFCQGNNVGVRYRVAQGEPTAYNVVFSEEALANGFHNVNWTAREAQDSVIFFAVPTDCPEGDYTAYVTFRNDAHRTTIPIAITFHVNIPNSYLVQVFDDVVSLDNSDLRFIDGNSQWYHNGEAVEGSKLYYQEVGGLTGEYSVRVNVGTATQGFVCPKTFSSAQKVSVIHVYPSPVVNRTNIKLQGFAEGEHQLQLFNSYGALVFSTQFSGVEYKLDLSAMPQGSYMINIDGRTAKTIKL